MLAFYYASGSCPSWRVWMCLEYRQIPYELRLLSFSERGHKQPEYLAVNPRGKVPAIVDDGFALYESVAIVEYLEDNYRDHGPSLFPGDAKHRAVIRRVVQEAMLYFDAEADKVVRQLGRKEKADLDVVREATSKMEKELAYYETLLGEGEGLVGPLSAADFTLYPFLAYMRRFWGRFPEHSLLGSIGPKLTAWEKRIEALPFYAKTYPPHWR